MRRLALLALTALVVLAPATAPAADQPRRTLTMTGTGQVQDAPDQATISAGVQTEARTAAAALEANTRAMSQAVASLKEAGIADRDLQTSRFQVSPVYSNNNNPQRNEPPRIVGYQVSNQLTVRVRDLARLGEILDQVVNQGANTINGPNFGFADPTERTDTARRRAVEDATRKARLYAEALGVSLGQIVSVDEQGGGFPRPEAMAMRVSRGADVPIEAGELTLTVNVNIVWELD